MSATPSTPRTPTPQELRARIAFKGVKQYVVGGLANVDPSRLSQYLNGHLPIPEAIAARISRAIEEAAGK